LERQTQIRESSVPVPTGTTSGLQERRKERSDCRTEKLLFQPENLILLNFQRKQDNKVILMREEKEKKGVRGPTIQKGEITVDEWWTVVGCFIWEILSKDKSNRIRIGQVREEILGNKK
jgi:hypothetical protein